MLRCPSSGSDEDRRERLQREELVPDQPHFCSVRSELSTSLLSSGLFWSWERKVIVICSLFRFPVQGGGVSGSCGSAKVNFDFKKRKKDKCSLIMFSLIIGESLTLTIADGKDRSKEFIDESKRPNGWSGVFNLFGWDLRLPKNLKSTSTKECPYSE